MKSNCFTLVLSSYFGKKQGDYVHLVADNPLNPLNIPDSWEKSALAELDAGADPPETRPFALWPTSSVNPSGKQTLPGVTAVKSLLFWHLDRVGAQK
jgi:hypothetical protein